MTIQTLLIIDYILSVVNAFVIFVLLPRNTFNGILMLINYIIMMILWFKESDILDYGKEKLNVFTKYNRTFKDNM